MDQKTIHQLNQINRDFYAATGAAFDATRQHVRAGWREVLEHLDRASAGGDPYHILDVGCGNARFGRFLFDRLGAPLFYHGVDANALLLRAASANVPPDSATLTQLDFITDIAQFRRLDGPYHCAVLNNVLHHVPSGALRRDLLTACADKLRAGGRLVFTMWLFWEKAKWRARVTPWSAYPAIDAAQLEPHDYLLDWRRGAWALRYSHYIDKAERDALIGALERHGLRMVVMFRADGKEDDLNQYVIMQKQP